MLSLQVTIASGGSLTLSATSPENGTATEEIEVRYSAEPLEIGFNSRYLLDIAAQIDLLDLVRELNHERGRTVVMILHDLNLAARYADLLVAMKDGKVVAAGRPRDVISEPLLRDVFSIEASILTDPRTGAPLVLPTRTVHDEAPELDAMDAVVGDLVLHGAFEGSGSVAGV